ELPHFDRLSRDACLDRSGAAAVDCRPGRRRSATRGCEDYGGCVMSRQFEIKLPVEEAYSRRSSFGIELLDAVTMSRVSYGVKVTAEGLQGRPVVNSGGVFVWLEEDLTPLQRLSIDPGILPYEKVELDRADLTLPPNPRPLTTVELSPRVDYTFAPGVTGLRGTLIEQRVVPPVPVQDGEIRLR